MAAVLLPWLAHAALGFADPQPERRWRAAWRSGLLLALVTAFAPVAWFFAFALGLVVVAAAFAIVPGAVRDRSVWGPPATAVACVPVLLAPWWLPALLHGAAGGLVLESGALPGPSFDSWGLVVGRLVERGAPDGLGVVLLLLAVAALLPRLTRIPVLVCWIVAAVAAVVAAVLGAITLDLPSGPARPGLGFLLVILQGTFVVAAMIGAQGLSARGALPVGRLTQAGVAVLAALAVAVPLGGLAWFVAGTGDQPGDASAEDIPAYMVQSSLLGPEHGILVLRGGIGDGLTYTLRRGDGVTVGEDEILALTPEDTDFSALVRGLTSRPTADLVDEPRRRGIEYVVLPAPADGAVAAGFDATAGLVQASAENRDTRAWQVSTPPDPAALDGPSSLLRPLLLALQGLGLVVVAVLCAPTTNRRRQT